MKKNGVFGGLVLLVCLCLFNVVAFVIPHEANGTFWCGYIFTTIAFLLQILFLFIAFGKADNIKKTFLGLPVAQLGVTYLILQVVWGLVCLFVNAIPLQAAVVVSAVLLGIYLIAIIAAMIGRNVVSDIDTKIKVQTFFVKSMLVDVEILIAKADSEEIKSELNKLAETVKYSDPMSNDVLANVDGRINDKYNELENAVDSSDIEAAINLCKDIDTLFVERNKKCKLLK